MAITYNAGTDTITITGYTAGTPGTFTDIYNADVAGGWGQVTMGRNVLVFSAKLQVGDGSTATYLHDTFKKITLNETWTVKNNAELKTGIQSGGHPRKGCFLVLNTTAATAITVESGGTYYMYQTLSEDTGTGTNLISGETEDFYRGAAAIDLKYSKNYIGIGYSEDNANNRVLESVLSYCSVFDRWNLTTSSWQTYYCYLPHTHPAQNFTDIDPNLGYTLTVNSGADCCLILDQLVDGEYYNLIWTGIANKWRFDIPAGGGGLMRNPPMTGGTV